MFTDAVLIKDPPDLPKGSLTWISVYKNSINLEKNSFEIVPVSKRIELDS